MLIPIQTHGKLTTTRLNGKYILDMRFVQGNNVQYGMVCFKNTIIEQRAKPKYSHHDSFAVCLLVF